MNQKLASRFNALESQRNQLMASLKNLDGQKLNQQPANGWSLNQVIAHLIAAERLSLQYINKKMLAINEVENTGVIEELKVLLLKISQRLPVKFKAPKVVVENTATATNTHDLEQAWVAVRSELKMLLEKLPDDQLKRKIYKHVVMGKLNVQHALIFFREHIIHHQHQIKRLM